MRILVVNRLLKWILDTFFNVNCLCSEKEDEILESLKKFLPDVFIFGDYKNSFSSSEGEEIYGTINRNKINLFVYGGWGGFGAGGYEGSFLEKLLNLSFRTEQLGQTLLKINKTDHSFLSLDFSSCPSIAVYHRVRIPHNEYQIQLYWGETAEGNPLLVSREVHGARQMVFLSSILPGGAKRFIVWPSYTSFLRECLEWLTNRRIEVAIPKDGKTPVLLRELLTRYWRDETTNEYLIEALNEATGIYEKEKLLLLRDISEFVEKWDISAISAQKLVKCESDKSLKTVNVRKAEYHKLLAYKYLDANSFTKASVEFEKSADLWKEIQEHYSDDLNASGFYCYFEGLSSFFQSLSIITSREGSPEEAKRIMDSASEFFELSKAAQGHGLTDMFIQFCNLFDIVVRYVNANQNTWRSYKESLYFLFNYVNLKRRINSSIQNLLCHYKQFIEQERWVFSLRGLSLYFSEVNSYYKQGLIDKEHFAALVYVKELLSPRLLIKISIKILSAFLLPILTILFGISSFVLPGYLLNLLTIFLITIAILVISSRML